MLRCGVISKTRIRRCDDLCDVAAPLLALLLTSSSRSQRIRRRRTRPASHQTNREHCVDRPGRAIGDSEQFLGLPYETTTSDLRSHQRSPGPGVNGTFDATRYGPPCHQTTGNWDDSPTETPRDPDDEPAPSEDCLLLNIFRPSARPSTPLPVLVWIHGGGLCGGSGSLAWHNATKLVARENVIVVTLNYRLGPLGFLALPELQRTYGANGGGNGFRDQLAALRWVKAHIGAFGGDAGALTIFGESSGGVSTCVLNASPEAAGLFRRAIVQSGPCIVAGEGWGPGSSAYGLELGANLTKRLGAPTLADLRRLPPQLLQWNKTRWWTTTSLATSSTASCCRRRRRRATPTPRARRTPPSSSSAPPQGRHGPNVRDGAAGDATAAEWRTMMAKRWGAAAAAVMGQYPLQSRSAATRRRRTSRRTPTSASCPSLEMAQLAPPPRGARHYSFAHLMLACDAGFATGTLPLPRSPALRVSHAGWASHGPTSSTPSARRTAPTRSPIMGTPPQARGARSTSASVRRRCRTRWATIGRRLPRRARRARRPGRLPVDAEAASGARRGRPRGRRIVQG